MRLKRIAAPIAALTLITSTAVMVPMSSGAAAYTAMKCYTERAVDKHPKIW